MSSILARAVIIESDRLLVARCKGWTHAFLPGGHVEPGEPPHECLKREIREELDVDCQVGTYLGRIEHSWEGCDGAVSEINHCFEVTLASAAVTSKEEHLEFTWLPVFEIPSMDLRPPALRTLIPGWIQGDSSHWEILQSN